MAFSSIGISDGPLVDGAKFADCSKVTNRAKTTGDARVLARISSKPS